MGIFGGKNIHRGLGVPTKKRFRGIFPVMSKSVTKKRGLFFEEERILLRG